MTGLTHRVLGAEVGIGMAAVGASIHHLALPVGLSIVVGAGALGMLAAQVPDWDLRLHLPHRGPTHSVIVCALLTTAATIAAHVIMPAALLLVAVVVGLALLSHLAADMTNKTPMALLWPVLEIVELVRNIKKRWQRMSWWQRLSLGWVRAVAFEFICGHRLRPRRLPFVLEDSRRGRIVEAVTVLGVGAAITPGILEWVR